MSQTMPLPGSTPPPTSTQRWLWVGLGALAATTLALGAALLQVYHRSAEEVSPAVPLTPLSAITATVEALPPLTDPVAAPEPVAEAAPVVKKSVPKVTKARSRPTQAASKSVATTTPTTAPATTASTTSTPLPALMCAQCGRVEAVTPIQREAAASGAGVVAGAVLGGLVGNQFGGGDGKTLATIAGMVGGGWAGNTVEKKMKTETVYRVDVRMENGSLRTLEQKEPIAVGAHVTVDGDSLHTSSPTN